MSRQEQSNTGASNKRCFQRHGSNRIRDSILVICFILSVIPIINNENLQTTGSGFSSEEKWEQLTNKSKRKKVESHKLAGLSCKAYVGPSDEHAAEMIYWQDIPEDSSFVSPFKSKEPQYLTFEQDARGFNNVRLSMETAVTMAIAMGRTIVLPPEQGIRHMNEDESP